MKARVLVVEDDPTMLKVLALELGEAGYEVDGVSSGHEALMRVREQDYASLLTDLHMPGMSGLSLCRQVVAERPDIPVVVITAFGSMETAIEAIRAGAYDFVTKPVEVDGLLVVLNRSVQHSRLRAELKRLRSVVAHQVDSGDIIGDSAAIRKLRDLLGRIAATESTVLITGESGTGKELVARAIHHASKRSDGPIVAVNCAAIPESLIESELFGHARGAFTDARSARAGLLAQAHGGTLFLDEIGELPLIAQAKLLRALQERVVRPVGSDHEVPFDARIVAATHRDLEQDVLEKRFREDLFFRIHVLHVELPPLRARSGDILLLAAHFLTDAARRTQKAVLQFAPAAAELLLAYHWPGNVRELFNCVEHAVALARFEQIVPEDLPQRIRVYRQSHIIVAGDDPSELVPLEEVERRYILRVLEAAAGNKRMAARILGLDRKTLYRKLERYGVDS